MNKTILTMTKVYLKEADRMASVPGVGGEVKTSNAVSKLVKMPGHELVESNGNTLEDKFLEIAVDRAYQDAFTRAHDPEAKLSILKIYAQQSEAFTSKSVWLKEAIWALTLGSAAGIDRRRKPADPLKDRIAKIKAQSPKLSHLKICSMLDGMKESLPKRWRSSSNSLWTDAYRDKKTNPRLKSYISKIKPSTTQL
jgi:hypothetical protein